MTSRKKLPPRLEFTPFRIAEARAEGVGEGRLRGPDLDRPFHGVRTASGVRATTSQFGEFASTQAAEEFAALASRCIAYSVLLKPGQFFSHTTAARLWKAPLRERFTAGEPLHVAATAPARAPEGRGVVGHQVSRANPRIVERFGLRVSDPAATWLSLGPLLGLDDLVAVGDHLVLDPAVLDPHDIRPHTSLAALADELRGSHGRGSRAAASALGLVRQGSESRPETLLRLLIVRAGLPEPELGVELRDVAGRWLGRFDMYYREWRVIVEYDGDAHRTDSRQYDKDIGRMEDVVRAGFTVVRVRKHGLFGEPFETVERVRRALLDAGWRP